MGYSSCKIYLLWWNQLELEGSASSPSPDGATANYDHKGALNTVAYILCRGITCNIASHILLVIFTCLICYISNISCCFPILICLSYENTIIVSHLNKYVIFFFMKTNMLSQFTPFHIFIFFIFWSKFQVYVPYAFWYIQHVWRPPKIGTRFFEMSFSWVPIYVGLPLHTI